MIRTVLRKIRTLFTTDPRWFVRYYRKYGWQRYYFLKDRLAGRTYWDVTTGGVHLKMHFHTPYHRSYAKALNENGIERHLIEPWTDAARRATVVYDIGGYNGIYGLLAAKANPASRVTIFEPDKVNGDHIRENIRINSLNNCALVEAPVAEREEVVRFTQHGTTGEHIGTEGKEMTTVSLASLESADLIKIDIEGFEVGVLRSIRTKPKGIILLELHTGFLERAGDSIESFDREIILGKWRYWLIGDRGTEKHYLLFG